MGGVIAMKLYYRKTKCQDEEVIGCLKKNYISLEINGDRIMSKKEDRIKLLLELSFGHLAPPVLVFPDREKVKKFKKMSKKELEKMRKEWKDYLEIE